MNDERPRGNGAPGEDDQAQEPQAHESGELTSGTAAEYEPEFGQTIPIVSRRLPSAQSFFGEPRPPRHSAHVDPPASAPEPALHDRDDSGAPLDRGPVGLPTEQPASEEPASEEPASEEPAGAGAVGTPPEPAPVRASPTSAPAATQPVTAPVAPPVAPSAGPPPEPDRPALDVPPPPSERVTSTAPHPLALDLSALQGGEDLIAPPSSSAESDEKPAPQPWHLGDDAPVLDPAALPAHDGDGETPTAAFGAVFGATPPAPAPVTPTPGSFTELISVPDDVLAPSAQPTSFNWSDLPEPRTAEVTVAPTPARYEPEPVVEDEVPAESEAGAAPERQVGGAPVQAPDAGDTAAQEPGLPAAAEPAPEAVPGSDAAGDDAPESPRAATFTELLGAIPHDSASGSHEQLASGPDVNADEAQPEPAPEPAPIMEPAPTQAMPTVWSLSDDEPDIATPSEPSSNPQPAWEQTAPASAPSPVLSSAAEPEPSNPPTDPFVALFGEELVHDVGGSEPAAAAEVPPTAPADSGGPDGAWADEFREPIPPALVDGEPGASDGSGVAEENDGGAAAAAAAAASAAAARASSPSVIPDSDVGGTPTVAYRPPFDTDSSPADTPTVAYHPPADDDESAPRFTPPPVYRGPSSRSVTPIDAANVPASWAAAAPAYGQAPQANSAGAASAAAPAWQPAAGGDQGAGGAGGTRGGGGFATWPRQRRLLLFIGIVAVFVVVLAILLFLVGRALASNGAAPAAVPSQAVTKTPTPSASRTSTPAPTAPTAAGPAAPGTHQWTDLTGGECLSSFTNAWQQTYQVVDCGAGHPAQMIAKGTVTATAYPGATALAAQVAPLCQSNTVIDFSKAASYTDIQVSASYPATQAQWDAGDHSYYCFVSRSSGQAITGSLRAGS